MVREEGVLIIAPTVHVVASTQFDEAGLNAWVKDREMESDEKFIGSPIWNLGMGTSLKTPEQDLSETVAEFAGRFCYNSFLKGRETPEYLANVIEMRHGSVLEHVNYTFAIEGVSRSLTHELVRHRAGFAISQESQRYVDAKDINFVVPPILLALYKDDEAGLAEALCEFAEQCESDLGAYKNLQDRIVSRLEELSPDADAKAKTMMKKRANEAARAHLPNAAETKLVWTGNLRALRHFCELRGDEHADLEIRRLATAMAEVMIERAPYTFFDMQTFDGDYGVGTVGVEYTKV